MTDAVLIVPIRVDGLFVPQPENVVSPPAFERLPYTAEGRDWNVGLPFLAETTHEPPFADTTRTLEPGVHIHWTLPRAIRSAVHPTDEHGLPQEDRLQFRPAPNRWLVLRTRNNNALRAWLVESDRVWAAPAAGSAPGEASVWPWRLVDGGAEGPRWEVPDGAPPWRNVGRVVPIEATRKSTRGDGERLPPDGVLRADGWGDPGFSAYYPACRSVFGLRDPDAHASHFQDGSSSATFDGYEVIGWYSDTNADPLVALRDRLTRLKATQEAAVQAGTRDKPALEVEPEVARLLPLEFGWSLPEASSPVRTVLVGRLPLSEVGTPNHDPIDGDVAIADSGTEALAAIVAVAMSGDARPDDATRARREDQLDAVLLARSLKGRRVDIGRHLDVARKRRSFQNHQGEVFWRVRSADADAAEKADLTLPMALALEIDALNAAQAAVDVARARADEAAEHVFADWYRSMLATNAPPGAGLEWVRAEHEHGGHGGPDSVFARMGTSTLVAVKQAQAALAQRSSEVEKSRSRATALLAAHNAQVGSEAWRLDRVPGAPWHAPADPALAFLSHPTGARDRWSELELPRTAAGALDCRVASVDIGVDGTAPCLDEARQMASAASIDALLPASRFGAAAGHALPLSMEWEVRWTPDEASGDDDYAADALTRPPGAKNASEVLQGSSLLTAGASTIIRSSLEAYVESRLKERAVAFDADGVVHPLVAALNPPKEMVWGSWLDLHGEQLSTTDAVRGYGNEISAWASQTADVRRIVAAAASLALYPAALGAAAVADDWYGVVANGPIAKAITEFVEDAIRAADIAEEKLNFPPNLGGALVRCDRRFSAIRQACEAEFSGPAPLARLLQQVDAEGLLATTRAPNPAVIGHPFVFGLPQHGSVERALCRLAEELTGVVLCDELGLSLDVVGSIVAARPIESLQQLAALPHMTASTFARLFYAVQVRADGLAALAAPPSAAGVPELGAELVDPLATAVRALATLDTLSNAVVNRLSGFHDMLLQRDTGPQLPVVDPTGFADYRAFADKVVRPIVGRSRRWAPRAQGGFHPLRSGTLELTRLRLVDTFGLPRDINLKSIVASARSAGDGPSSLRLAPRVTQSARIEARWCDADGDGEAWTAWPGSSPICGWANVDTADGTLAFHSAEGIALGSLDREGTWRVAPGRSGPVHVGDIDNTTLRRLALHVAERARDDRNADSPNWFESLLADLEHGLENIHPAAHPAEEAMAMLSSRPMAIVRVATSVRLRTSPARRQDSASLSREVGGASPSTRGLESVDIPLEVGRHDHLSDGVVAWWETDADGGPRGEARLPVGGATVLPLRLSEARDRLLVMLVDPRASVHFSTAVLPTRELAIPAQFYGPALEAIDAFVYVGPVRCRRPSLPA